MNIFIAQKNQHACHYSTSSKYTLTTDSVARHLEESTFCMWSLTFNSAVATQLIFF